MLRLKQLTRSRLTAIHSLSGLQVCSSHSSLTPRNDINAYTLAEVFSPHLTSQRKSAFTLAEVLITLGIIGVVAAMTMPALIANKQKEELRTALKKNYSVMQQAVQRMSVDTGETVRPELYPTHKFKPEFMKYFNTLKDCGYGSSQADACVPNFGDSEGTSLLYTTLNSKKAGLGILDDGQFILTDGSLYLIENNGGPIYITVDVNGINKRPNRWGYDLFTFQLTNEGKILPMGAEGTSFTDKSSYCSKTSSYTYNGIACTNDALYNKDYWKSL